MFVSRFVLTVFAIAAWFLAGLAGFSSLPSVAQEGTPVAVGTPDAGCAKTDDTSDDITYAPSAEDEAAITAPWMNDGFLYLAEIQLPAHSCTDYRTRSAAVIVYVTEGTVVFTSQMADEPGVVVVRGDSDGAPGNNTSVVVGSSETLDEGQWLGWDRRIWFTFENDTDSPATMIAAVYGTPPWDQTPCTGSCRDRP